MKYLIFMLIFIAISNSAYGSTIEVTVDLDNNNCFTCQTLLGTFLTGSVREVTGADIAMLSSSAIKGNLYKGRIESSSLSNLFYYPDDRVILIELKGSQIKDIMERSIRNYPDESTDFLQVSGLNGIFSPYGKGGNRLTDIYIGNKVLDLAAIYKVAVDETLASGFSGYIMFTQGKILNSKFTLREAIELYIKSRQVIVRPEEAGLKTK